jgi:hypothetical protein
MHGRKTYVSEKEEREEVYEGIGQVLVLLSGEPYLANEVNRVSCTKKEHLPASTQW